MGYRSDVVYRIVFDNEDTMKLFIAEAKSREDTRLAFVGEEGEEFLEQVEDTLELRFMGNGWKWYSEYEVVKAHENVLGVAREYSERTESVRNDNGDMVEKVVGDVQYAFARIGEDMEDMEVYGSEDYYSLLDIDRSIKIW